MPPRRRIKKGLEPNLYENNGYFKYRHPLTRKERGMGKDKKKAVAAARQLNAMLMDGQDLIERVLGSFNTNHTLTYVIDRYIDEYLPSKELKSSSKDAEIGRLNRLKKDLGQETLDKFSVRFCAEYLDENFMRTPYVKYRGTLKSLFEFSKRKGLYSGENPIDATEKKTRQANKKFRQRMTLDQYLSLRKASPEWLQNAMDFSLLTLQGLNEVVNAKFEHIDRETNRLRIIRKKTDKHDWAFLELDISPDFEDILNRSASSGIKSPFIIHHRPKRKNPDNTKEHWTQILPNYLGSELRRIRDSLEIFTIMPKEHRPTFHEIRALGAHLYDKHGFSDKEYVQPLMAHSDVEMTKHYQSGHEIKWNRVRAELSLEAIFRD
jgi:integrase